MNTGWIICLCVVGLLFLLVIVGIIVYSTRNKQAKPLPRKVRAPKPRHVVLDQEECGPGYTRAPGTLYFPTGGADSITSGDLRGEKLTELPLAVLHSRGLTPHDLRGFSWQGESWIFVSTGTSRALLHSKKEDRIIETNVSATDVWVNRDHFYCLSRGQVWRYPINNGMSDTRWQMIPMQGFPENIRALEGSHHSDEFSISNSDGTFYVRDDAVYEHEQQKNPLILGASAEERITFSDSGAEVMPNRVHLPGVHAGVITDKNRFFFLDAKDNQWVHRVRSLQGEPVLFSKSACVPNNSAAFTPRVVG